ncbi:MAG TPA: hypothetical protein VIS96_07000 [Terrimicrobiaceae bacterium]
MSVVVAYPVEVKRYQVFAMRDRAEILLEGVEGPEQVGSDPNANIRRVGRITFGDPNPISDKDFITRGGFLQMDRSLEFFSGILDLLRNEKPLFLSGDGTLSTSLKPTSEEG